MLLGNNKQVSLSWTPWLQQTSVPLEPEQILLGRNKQVPLSDWTYALWLQ